MPTNSMSHTHRLFDIVKAIARFIPRLPTFLLANIRLKRARGSDIGSTGLSLQQVAQRYPERTFLKFEGVTYSYAEFNRWVNQLAHAFASQGVGRGDCVALMFENSPEQLACVFAVNKLGATAGMMNYKQRDSVLAHSISIIQPKLFVVGDDCADALASLPNLPNNLLDGVPCLSMESSPSPGWLDLTALAGNMPDSNLAVTETIQLQETCFYVFTSGTTGMPKSAAMTHLRWYKAGIGFGRMALRLRADDVHYCCLPLYHNTALSASLSTVIATASTLALARRFRVSEFWQDIREHGATSFVYIGELCRYLLNQPVAPDDKAHQVRAVLGNGLRAEVWDRFQNRFGIPYIYELYGASEGNIGFVNVFNLKRTVGFSPMRFAVVRFDYEKEQPIVDTRGFMLRVQKGDVGLLLAEISKNTPFDGYTNNQDASSAKVLRGVFKPGDAWFHTGDLVRDQGFRHIAFIDRVGDTFRWKSENVATTQVEAEIQTLQEINEAVVYGVQVPHTEGRAGMVSLSIRQGLEFDPVQFYRNLKDRLPDYAIPLFVRLRQGYHDTTATLKIKKTELKQQGFRIQDGQEPIYVLVNREQGYQPLDAGILERIQDGELRF
ncbi:long-chain-acyl-CoA synthetase [Aliidiomarina indica]|uniref:long-chain-acyl-CoA synthetase n=1 Tax=Aliidiomarina indica TaxID=2749147 RepID=UPI001E2DB4ED|nr:long-chain-acyl-CoA synthetase [Aliidiomarina indica]